MVDMDDIYTEQRDYDGYELERQERESIEEVQNLLAHGFEDEEQVRECTDYLEHLNKKVADVIRNEEAIGYRNETLRHDYEKIKALLARCHQELHRMDAVGSGRSGTGSSQQT